MSLSTDILNALNTRKRIDGMAQAYQPEGFQSIIPYLTVRGADGLVDFLKQAFAAEESDRNLRDDGTIGHIALRIGDSMLEISEANATYEPMVCAVHIYVADTDAAYARALAAGGTSLYPVEDKEYGERSAGVRDPAGNSWYIATYLGNRPQSAQV